VGGGREEMCRVLKTTGYHGKLIVWKKAKGKTDEIKVPNIMWK